MALQSLSPVVTFGLNLGAGGFDPSVLLGPLPSFQPPAVRARQQGGGGILSELVGLGSKKLAEEGVKKLGAMIFGTAPGVPEVVSGTAVTATAPAAPEIVGASFLPETTATTPGLGALSTAGPAIAALAAAPIARAIDKATDKSIAEQNRDVLRARLEQFTPLGEDRVFINSKGQDVEFGSTEIDLNNPIMKEAALVSDLATDQILDSIIAGEKERELETLAKTPDVSTQFLSELPDSERKQQLVSGREAQFREQFRPFLNDMVINAISKGANNASDVEENLLSLLEQF